MSDPRRQVWRASRNTLTVSIVFGALCLVGITACAVLIWARHHQLWLPILLVVLALAGAGYAWRFGLHPKITAEDDELVIDNPFRTFSFDWRDIAAVWPGGDGIVVVADDQRVEAWCVQKSDTAIKAGQRTRADDICDQIWRRWEDHHPPLETEDGLIIRRARPGQEADLAQLERSASTAALGHVFPPETFPYPIEAVTSRWKDVLRDPGKESVIAVHEQTSVGYAAHDWGTVLHLGVLGDRQRRGIGSQLLAWAEDEIFADPTLTEASLWVLEENRQARAFYRDHGWRDTDDRRESEYPPEPTELRMSKINPRLARRGRS